MSEDRIKLRIDLKSGTLELDCPSGEFDSAIQKTKDFAASLQFGEKGAAMAQQVNDGAAGSAMGSQLSASQVMKAKSKEKVRNSGAKSSTGRAGRLGSFDPIRDLLSEAQHKEIYAYMQAKAPADQEDQILVAAHKGEQLLGRQGFTYNELYTLLWRAGVDPLPKAIDVVVQRLIQDQKMDKGDTGYFMKFLGQSRVEKELPPSSKDAA
jgi:hypothetical protein